MGHDPILDWWHDRFFKKREIWLDEQNKVINELFRFNHSFKHYLIRIYKIKFYVFPSLFSYSFKNIATYIYSPGQKTHSSVASKMSNFLALSMGENLKYFVPNFEIFSDFLPLLIGQLKNLSEVFIVFIVWWIFF